MTVHHLQNSTDFKDDRSNDKRPSSSEPSRNGPNDEAAKEGAGLKHTDGVGVDARLLSFAVSKVVLERLEG